MTAVNWEYFVCFLVITMHVLGSCEASAQYSPINFFVNLFLSKNSNLIDCFSDLIHTEYRKLHKNNGHSPFVSPSIMRSSVGQCRNIRFRQLSASHVIITSENRHWMLKCCYVISKFNSRAGNTVAWVVENDRLHRLKSTSHARTCTENGWHGCLFNCSCN